PRSRRVFPSTLDITAERTPRRSERWWGKGFAMVQQVALVSQAPSVPHAEVSRVSAALQKQVTRDFGPIWDVTATVDGFADLSDVPLGYWPVIVRDDVGDKYDAAGIHLDDNGQPVSLVQACDHWAQTG